MRNKYSAIWRWIAFFVVKGDEEYMGTEWLFAKSLPSDRIELLILDEAYFPLCVHLCWQQWDGKRHFKSFFSGVHIILQFNYMLSNRTTGWEILKAKEKELLRTGIRKELLYDCFSSFLFELVTKRSDGLTIFDIAKLCSTAKQTTTWAKCICT